MGAVCAKTTRRRWLREAGLSLRGVLYPARCGGCDEPSVVPLPYGLCSICLEVLELIDPHSCRRCALPRLQCACQTLRPAFDRVVAPFVYGGPLADAVARIKFRKRIDLAGGLATLLARSIRVHADGIVPMPLSRSRLWQRGFNQSQQMARTVAQHWHGRVHNTLIRVKDTQRQSDLRVSERRNNVAGAFRARPVKIPHVILLDDVMTSGHTANEAARALKHAGAQRVTVVVLARAL